MASKNKQNGFQKTNKMASGKENGGLKTKMASRKTNCFQEYKMASRKQMASEKNKVYFRDNMGTISLKFKRGTVGYKLRYFALEKELLNFCETASGSTQQQMNSS